MNNTFKEIQFITIIGKGNVAWQYNNAMANLGINVNCISSRGEIREEDLGSDLIIIAVLDKAIEEVAGKLRIKDSILVHTSGTVDIEVLNKSSENYGIFYPLQTITKGIQINFSDVPLCIDANNENTLACLKHLAKRLTDKVYEINTSQRQELHLAAVFANNFTNHLLGISKQILERENIPFDIIFPLINQTIEKAKQNNPFDVQTGPAKRQEMAIMENHKSRLDDDEREIYEILSNKIIKKQDSLKDNK
ncbi:MAG: hypothetical protein H6Q16_1617 [Bacteroidetes bacterium]|nr:hypothetical protein [Bacteroidota bacterium]